MADDNKLPEDTASQIQALQEKLLAAQEALSKETVTASAGDGAVKISLTGDQRCTAVEIDPSVMDDATALQDLLLEALNKALKESRQLAAEYLSPYSQG